MQGSLKHAKVSLMPPKQAADVQIDVVHHYLEREFPGQVTPPWREHHADGPVIEIVHGAVRHQIEVASAFLENCPDCMDNLRHSELADYVREARTQNRRFVVLWQGGEVRIRSKLR
jgi:hypothetical protein